MRHLLLAVLVVGALAFGGGTTAAGAQDGPTTTTTTAEVPPGEIIPRPNSGAAPEDAGDRGGALQLGLLFVVVAVIAGGVANVVRHSRRARSDRAG